MKNNQETAQEMSGKPPFYTLSYENNLIFVNFSLLFEIYSLKNNCDECYF